MIFNLLAFLFVIGLLLIPHELGHFLAARLSGIKVERFSIGFGPPLFKFKWKETLFLVCLIPLGGYVKMAGEKREECQGKTWEFFSKPVGVRAKVVFSGPIANIILGFIIFWIIFMIGVPIPKPIVGDVLKEYPAYKAGIEKGDYIISINGKDVEDWFDINRLIKENRKKYIEMVVLRKGRKKKIVISPQIKKMKDIFGRENKFPFIGIKASSQFKIVKFNPFVAFFKSLEKIGIITIMLFKSLLFIILGILPFKEAIAGPLGIFQITSQVAHQGILPLIDTVGMLSVVLAIINLFPIPVLDGGYLVFFLIEKIRKRPLSEKVENLVIQIGMAILVILFILATYSDILRLWKK